MNTLTTDEINKIEAIFANEFDKLPEDLKKGVSKLIASHRLLYTRQEVVKQQIINLLEK